MPRFWPTFVGCGSSDSLVFGALAVLFWPASFFWHCWGCHSVPAVLLKGVKVASQGLLVLQVHLLSWEVGGVKANGALSSHVTE